MSNIKTQFDWLKILIRIREKNVIGSRREREKGKNLDWICYSCNDKREEKKKLLDEQAYASGHLFTLLILFLIIEKNLYLFKQEKKIFRV